MAASSSEQGQGVPSTVVCRGLAGRGGVEQSRAGMQHRHVSTVAQGEIIVTSAAEALPAPQRTGAATGPAAA